MDHSYQSTLDTIAAAHSSNSTAQPLTSTIAYPNWLTTLWLLSICLLTSLLPLQTTQASPAHLDQWQQWILEEHPNVLCPRNYGNIKQHICAWPTTMTIDLNDFGASFQYSITVYREMLAPLPGNQRHWPQEVQVNGKNVPVGEQNGQPFVLLPPGQFTLEGVFKWQERPAQLQVPDKLALLKLTDKRRSLPVNRQGNQLLLRRIAEPKTEESQQQNDSLTLDVFHKLTDGVPMSVETRLQLAVSGKPREVTLGRALAGYQVLESIHSPLPARLEANGQLRVQLKAGQYVITLHSRTRGNVLEFSSRPRSEAWPEQEFWSFQSDQDIRTLSPPAEQTVDTSQIPLPPEWRQLPTYKVDKQTPLAFTRVSRGDTQPPENRLQVQRDLWLDFDGNGYTSRDQITGNMYQGWRLNSGPDVTPGRATVAGQPVLITQVNGQPGIEIRSPQVDLTAIGRLPDNPVLLATGWQADVDALQTTLHLPPGWRALHVAGVDNSQGTWLANWSLWDIFICLLLVVIIARVTNLPLAILSVAMLLLSYQEHNAPLTTWFILVIALALLSRVPAGKLKKLTLSISATTVLALVMILISFSIEQIRLAMYPHLERNFTPREFQSITATSSMDTGGTNSVRLSDQDNFESTTAIAIESDISGYKRKHKASPASPLASVAPSRYQIGKNDIIQTGPGLPRWQWQDIQLHWAGPVSQQQTITPYLAPPLVTRLWRLVSVALCVVLAAALIARLLPYWREYSRSASSNNNNNDNTPDATTNSSNLSTATAFAALTLGAAMFSTPDAFAQGNTGNSAFDPSLRNNLHTIIDLRDPPAHQPNYPPESYLKQLEQRLTRAPECGKACLSISNGIIQARSNTLTIQLRVDTLTHISLPLPEGQQAWRADKVTINGSAANALRRNKQGELITALPPGQHLIQIQTPLTNQPMPIYFPKPVHNLQFQGNGWHISGLIDGRAPSGAVEIRPSQAISTLR